MLNERSQIRAQLVYHLRMFHDESRDVLGYVSNISTDGVRLLTETPISVNSRLTLRLELPHTIVGVKVLSLQAINMWSNSSTRKNFYESGFRFTGVSGIEKECIARLMVDYGLGTSVHWSRAESSADSRVR